MQQHQRRLRIVPGVQKAGAPTPRLDVALLEWHGLQVAPDALESLHVHLSL
jgi:hypothetical protein